MKTNSPFFLLLLLLCSCGPNWSKPDETISLIPVAKEWIVDNPEMLNFIMIGSDSTQLHFKEDYSGYGIGGNSATSDGFLSGYYIIAREKFSQYYMINDSLFKYWIEMEPSSSKDMGNQLTFSLFNSRWQYDISYNQLRSVALELPDDFETKWWSHDQINSTSELIDSLTINNAVCDSIMHFTLNDFTNKFTDETVTELYYAKHIGLVKFVKHSGMHFDRVW